MVLHSCGRVGRCRIKSQKPVNTDGLFILKHFLNTATLKQTRLSNRSALEWILDQYKETKPKDRTIAERFHTYRFADYKEQVIDLLQRVSTVSVETMNIVREMERESKS